MLHLPAWWVPIILYSDISNSQKQKHGEALLNDENDPNNLDCLSQLRGLQYSQLYIPFIQHCGLITMKNRWGRTNPVLCITMENKLGSAYSWEEFFAEYRLHPEISQLAYTFNNHGTKQYYIHVGTFEGRPFTI
jgi:hypothetical protein